MGIYISNLEMPKRGMVVNIYADGRVTNHFDEFGKTIGKAVPVPPHGDLIDRAALLETIKEARKKDPEIEDVYIDDYFMVAEWVVSAPTIIEAEDGE